MLLISNRLKIVKQWKLKDIRSLLIGVRSNKEKDMDREYYSILMVEYIKATGVIIKETAKAFKNLRIALSIKETMLTVNLKDVVDMNGRMEKFIKVNGKMGLNMDQEYGEDQKVTLILENGKREKHKVMEFILGPMEIDIKDNLRIV